jgi:hypothetical protein
VRKNAIRWLAVLGFALMIFGPNLTAWAKPAQQFTVTPGMVVGLQGTPHIFVGDDQGVLHWGGDTRGLNGRNVNWANRRDVTLDQLKSMQRGDPWLSAGLLKIGDPIYLVKWETDQPAPTLLHIQSIGDVELFGINANNYGSFVLTPTAWQQKYGMSTDNLARGELVGAVATATPAATATAVNRMSVRVLGVDRPDIGTFRTTLEITDTPNTRISVSLVRDEYNSCGGGCGTDQSTNHDSWGPYDAGGTNNEGKLQYVDQHAPYKTYTYTFTDAAGNSASITLGSDLSRGL